MADEPTVDDQNTAVSPTEVNSPDDAGEGIAVEGSQPQPDQQESVGSGSDATNQRIRRLSADKRKALQQADYWRDVARRYAQADASATQQAPAGQQPKQGQYSVQQPQPYPDQEVEQAFSTLRQRGMVTRDELDEVMLRIDWDRTHDRNEAEINRRGSNLPRYDRAEVEAHARRKDLADPMAAYRDLYFDEILDSAKRGDYRGTPSKRVSTAKPTRASDTDREPLTLDSFKGKLRGKEGREYYEKLLQDPDQFDDVIRQLSEQEG